MRCADIGDFLGVPTGTVKRRLHDVRKRLRSMLLGYIEAPKPKEGRKTATPKRGLPL